MEAEYEKYGEAMKLGWLVYSCGPNMVKNGSSIQLVESLIELRGK